MRLELEEKIQAVDEQENLPRVSMVKAVTAKEQLTTLVPRLIFRDWASANAVSVNDA